MVSAARSAHSHGLVDDAGLLQEVFRYLSAHHCAPTRELHFEILPEAAGVVVDDGAGVTEGLHQVVHQQDLLLEGSVVCLQKKRNVTPLRLINISI